MNNVLDCKVLNTSPFCLSIDTNSVIRVWDIRTFVTSQVFTIDRELFSPYIYLLTDDNFLLCSKSLFTIVNEDAEVKRAFLKTVVPLWVEFNEYHKVFVVVTKYDVRLYSCATGRLEEVFVDLLESGRKQDMVRTFAVGYRERMFYLGDSAGNVFMFNTKNAERLKAVTDREKDNEVIERFMRIMQVRDAQHSLFKDVSALLYLEDDKVLVVGTVNSYIKLYDEIDSEESELSRVFIGGHLDTPISVLAYCRETDQLASGSDNGVVTVWNLGSGRIDNFFFDGAGKVVQVHFLFPHPYLVVVQQSGVVNVWGLKQSGAELTGKCLLKLLNLVALSENPAPAGRLEKLDSGAVLHTKKQLFPKNRTLSADLSEKASLALSLQAVQSLRPESDLGKIYNDFTNKQADALTGAQAAGPARGPDSEKERVYVLLGSEAGSVHIVDLFPFLEALKLHLAKIKPERREGKKIKRHESVAANAHLQSHLNHLPSKPVYRNTYPLHQSFLVQSHPGLHAASISAIKLLANSHDTVLTASCDSTVKLWSPGWSLLGQIDLHGGRSPAPWKFSYDWLNELLRGAREAIEVEEAIEEARYPEDKKNELLNRELARGTLQWRARELRREEDPNPEPGSMPDAPYSSLARTHVKLESRYFLPSFNPEKSLLFVKPATKKKSLWLDHSPKSRKTEASLAERKAHSKALAVNNRSASRGPLASQKPNNTSLQEIVHSKDFTSKPISIMTEYNHTAEKETRRRKDRFLKNESNSGLRQPTDFVESLRFKFDRIDKEVLNRRALPRGFIPMLDSLQTIEEGTARGRPHPRNKLQVSSTTRHKDHPQKQQPSQYLDISYSNIKLGKQDRFEEYHKNGGFLTGRMTEKKQPKKLNVSDLSPAYQTDLKPRLKTDAVHKFDSSSKTAAAETFTALKQQAIARNSAYLLKTRQGKTALVGPSALPRLDYSTKAKDPVEKFNTFMKNLQTSYQKINQSSKIAPFRKLASTMIKAKPLTDTSEASESGLEKKTLEGLAEKDTDSNREKASSIPYESPNPKHRPPKD